MSFKIASEQFINILVDRLDVFEPNTRDLFGKDTMKLGIEARDTAPLVAAQTGLR